MRDVHLILDVFQDEYALIWLSINAQYANSAASDNEQLVN